MSVSQYLFPLFLASCVVVAAARKATNTTTTTILHIRLCVQKLEGKRKKKESVSQSIALFMHSSKAREYFLKGDNATKDWRYNLGSWSFWQRLISIPKEVDKHLFSL